MKRVGQGQIAKVYHAYASGCRTTAEVSALTGLALKTCAAYTARLIERGRLECTGLAPLRAKGGHARWYEPVGRQR
jgi:hypothetical protein